MQANTIILYSHHAVDTPSFRWLNRVYTELFSRIGFNIDIRFMPSARASQEAEKGIIDGQFGRIYQYQDLYPNQLRIDIPVYTMTLEAFGRTQDNITLTQGWQSFVNRDYLVNYQRGMVISQQNLEKNVSSQYLDTVTSIEQGFLKLKHGRSDIFIFSTAGGYPYLISPEFDTLIEPKGIMERKNVYLYLHKKHKALVPQLERVLTAMENEGLIKRYCLQAFLIKGPAICRQLLSPINEH